MAEAVIVDSVRTPIGRAFKGSMKDLRPDETAAFVIDALLGLTRLFARSRGLYPAASSSSLSAPNTGP